MMNTLYDMIAMVGYARDKLTEGKPIQQSIFDDVIKVLEGTRPIRPKFIPGTAGERAASYRCNCGIKVVHNYHDSTQNFCVNCGVKFDFEPKVTINEKGEKIYEW